MILASIKFGKKINFSLVLLYTTFILLYSDNIMK